MPGSTVQRKRTLPTRSVRKLVSVHDIAKKFFRYRDRHRTENARKMFASVSGIIVVSIGLRAIVNW